VVIVKTTISVALIAVVYIISMTAFLQQIAKKLGVHAVPKGTGNIVVSVASGIQIWAMMSAVTLIVTA
jgi:ribonuclease HIII